MADIILKTLYSKRNKIQLVDKNGLVCVCKTFKDRQDFLREKEELLALDGLNVPKIITEHNNSIYMTYIKGELFLDSYLSATESSARQLASLLGDFIIEYSRLRQGKRLIDMNFRNFILSNGQIYGVDFEETGKGEIMLSVASAIAFARLYEVKESVKEEFEKSILQKFDFDNKVFQTALDREMSFLLKRRNLLI